MRKSFERARWPWVVAGLTVCCLYALSLLDFDPGDTRPTGRVEDIEKLAARDDVNVLFVLIDTLRAHRLGSYGYERNTSPSLDYLASTGVRFAKHISQSSWTKCSMASLWTGLLPARTAVTRYDHALPEDAVMPAEILRDAGFKTAGVWRNGWVAPNFGFGQGFSLYEKPSVARVERAVKRANPNAALAGTDNDIVDSAIEFVRVQGDDRWFLYVHLMDLHQYIYSPDTALFGNGYADLYDNSIRFEDGILARLVSHLSDTGKLEKTLVVIASDHGEAFGERGHEGHARFVYRETTDVPLVIAFPFVLEPGVVVESMTRNIDIWPTLLDLLGLPVLPDADGRSALPEILASARGEEAPDDRVSYSHLDRHWGRPGTEALPVVSVAEGGLRYFHRFEEEGSVKAELYDMREDPLERTDLLEDRPEDADTLRAKALEYLGASRPPPWGSTPSVDIDEMQLNQLRALGYSLPGR
jgi:arylsulfatase A-like enzyme